MGVSFRNMTLALAGTVATMTASPVWAAGGVAVSSEVFVERTIRAADGTQTRTLARPETVTAGDSLVFVVGFRNEGPRTARGLSLTNPLPAAVAYDGRGSGDQLVSVDGGRSWGTLDTLRVPASGGGSRAAIGRDVTHVKWSIDRSLAAGSAGKRIFRGTVR